MKIAKNILIILFLLSTILFWMGCEKAPTPPATTSENKNFALVKISGNNQSATINSSLTQSLKVQVQDASGGATEGVSVSFSVSSGGGTLSTTTATTDVNGFVESNWTLGATEGMQTVSVTANVTQGSPQIFSAQGTAITANNSLVKISGDNQSDIVGQLLSLPLKIKVQNSFGTAVDGISVSFSVNSGGGNLSTTTATTDINGYAETFWTLGSLIGTQTVSVTAQVSNGSPLSFSATAGASTTFVDSRDGEVYKKVTIGSQIWMAENLRYNAPGSSYNPNNPTTNYGRLYSWTTLMDGASSSSASPSGVQGLCPSGWHLPSDAEWTTLTTTIGGNDIGTAMKSTDWVNGNGTNSSGFNALPAGHYTSAGYLYFGSHADFWSTTEHPTSTGLAVVRILKSATTGVDIYNDYKYFSFSCRCVKD